MGSVQIRNRATLAGQPVQRVAGGGHGAGAAGPRRGGRRRRAGRRRGGSRSTTFFVRSGVTTLRPGELVTAIEMPMADGAVAGAHAAADPAARPRPGLGHARLRGSTARGRRGSRSEPSVRGRCCGSDGAACSRTGGVGGGARGGAEAVLADATPSATSMRARPEYRLAMLRVLGLRALEAARPASRRGRRMTAPSRRASRCRARHGQRRRVDGRRSSRTTRCSRCCATTSA